MQKPVLLLSSALLWLGVALACGGDSTRSEPVPVEGPEPRASAPPASGDSLLTAGVQWGSQLCLSKAGDNCVEAATTFATDTPVIYFVHQTRELPRTGQTYNIRWVAVDVGSAAPPNTVVFDLNEVVTDGMLLKVFTHYTISSEASKPTAGWPAGRYEVVVTLDGAPVTTAPFTVG